MAALSVTTRDGLTYIPADTTIVVAGDWHGNTTFAVEAIRTAAECGADIIIHVGDFGAWPKNGFWSFGAAVSAALVEAGIELWFVDGNHENFDWLLSHPVGADGRRELAPNLFHLPRGWRWMAGDTVWLALGGAASVDRDWRIEGNSWWPDEYITDDDVALAIAGGPADVMVCHDAPYSTPQMFAKYTSANGWPQRDVDLSNANRQRIEDVMIATGATRLFHGHYHDRYINSFELAGEERWVMGLDKDESSFSANMVFVNARGHLT